MSHWLRGGIVAFLFFSLFVSPVAFADESSKESLQQVAAQEDSNKTTFEDVVVSAEKDAAIIEGYPFALDSFSRAQVGSNREINNTYYGYSYYMGTSPDMVAAVASEEHVVVYVPPIAESVGYSVSSNDDQEALKRCLLALDAQNARGGVLLSEIETWYFTTDNSYIVEGVVFNFAQELNESRFYTSVIGEDGSDVTNADNPRFLSLTHADFGVLVPSDQATIVAEKTGLDAVIEFLSTLDYSPLWVTLKTTSVAIVFIFILGLAAAYFSLRIPARAQDVVDSLFTIPMVLPPTVCGFLLLLLLGNNTPLGQWFIDIGFPLIFSWPATVIAAIVVAFPLMYRSARGAFEGLDNNMLDAARTLGWSNRKVFFKLMLPLSWSSIAAGTVLALARALGEFGATLFLAGNYLGITRTIPIAIYFEWMNGNTESAIFWTLVIIVFSFIIILFINLFSRRTTKYRRGSDT